MATFKQNKIDFQCSKKYLYSNENFCAEYDPMRSLLYFNSLVENI